MKKIIQLEEYEYNKLQEMADLNEQKMPEMIMQKLSNNQLTMELRTYIDEDRLECIDFRVYSFFTNYYDKEIKVFPEDMQGVSDFLNEVMMKKFQRKFGKQITDRNFYAGKLREVETFRKKFILFSSIGWITAATLFIVALLK